MANKVRLEDIARECGVTKGLVSRALAGKYNVGDETRNIIMQKAVELGYDFTKLRHKKNKTKSVVIVVGQTILMKEDFWQPILKSLYATLNRLSFKLEYCQAIPFGPRTDSFKLNIFSGKYGLILSGS